MKKAMKRIANIIASLILAVLVGLPYFSASPVPVAKVSADNSVKPLDETYIIDDLGEEVVANFKAVEGAKPQLYSFSEFGFSQNAVLRETAYGLYLYVYNPSRTRYAERIGASVANIATAYGPDGKPSSYENLPLKNCGYTTGKYDKLFYKFRIMDTEEVEENAIAGNTKNGKRRYDLAGFQLLEDGQELAKDYSIATTYYVSGYGKGCGAGAENESTLKVEWEELDTIELTVRHTNYRTGEYVDNVCDELNTVYFSVPERYFEDYGGLQKIKAEWYEYKTNPVFITSNADAYNALCDYRTTNIGEYTSNLDYRVVWESEYGPYNDSFFPSHLWTYYQSYNATIGEIYDDGLARRAELSANRSYTNKVDWLFKKDLEEDKTYAVSREEVEDYMDWYTENYPLQIKVANMYSEGLFSSSIDTDRLALLKDKSSTRGYIVQEIDAGDSQDLLFKAEQSWWDLTWNGVKYEEKGYEPIVVLTASDIAGLNSNTFAEKFLINDTDKETVFVHVKEMIEKGERAVLFRFAVTDYYASIADFDQISNADDDFSTDGYVAQETVFLNFDIISLTFRKDGIDSVIACVSDPINIINGFDPPNGLNAGKDDSGALKKLIALIVLIVVVIFIIWLIRKLFGNKQKVTVKVKHSGKKKH